MPASIMDSYIAVIAMSDEAVKGEYGVSKANTLKVLKKLLVAELTSDLVTEKPAARKAVKARNPRKPRTPRKSAPHTETE